ncbi:hypothetical protein BMT54_10200 [Pasteurellaceae bacterium 15-036681]|nr:hypothetical protein BMT54_10200 [Pasteurellaceae bacterium 15-036681]
MKLKKYLAILPLAVATLAVSAETATSADSKSSTFQFSTQVSRTVDKDLMQAEVYSRKSGKNLADLKKSVSTNLNKVLELAKKNSTIEVSADGVSNYADYNDKGKVIGWVAEGRIQLKGKDFEAIAQVLENLGDEVAISDINFSVSPEKMASLEDEMTLEIIKQFQHKAEVIQKGLNSKGYVLSDVQLDTPNSSTANYAPRMYAAEAKVAAFKSSADELPMEAGKQTISASASGKVKFD